MSAIAKVAYYLDKTNSSQKEIDSIIDRYFMYKSLDLESGWKIVENKQENNKKEKNGAWKCTCECMHSGDCSCCDQGFIGNIYRENKDDTNKDEDKVNRNDLLNSLDELEEEYELDIQKRKERQAKKNSLRAFDDADTRKEMFDEYEPPSGRDKKKQIDFFMEDREKRIQDARNICDLNSFVDSPQELSKESCDKFMEDREKRLKKVHYPTPVIERNEELEEVELSKIPSLFSVFQRLKNDSGSESITKD